MKYTTLATITAIALCSNSVLAETSGLNDGFQGTWFSHVNTPHGFATPLPKAAGNWEVKGLIKPTFISNAVDGSDKGAAIKAKVQVNGNYEFTENFRFITEAWVTGDFEQNKMHWERDYNTPVLNQDPIYFEQLQIGFEHKTLGALTVGKQVTQWGAGTIFDQYNMFGLTELQLNAKNDGTKIFYHNKWDNKWLVRAVYRPESPVYEVHAASPARTEGTWGMTFAYDTFSPYARGFDGWGIYYDVTNEHFATQYGDAPSDSFGTGGAAAGGYQYHNANHENLVHAVSSYIRTGAWYLAGNLSYSNMDDGKSLDDTLENSGFQRAGMVYEDGVGLSATAMARYTFKNGFEPLVSVGNDITGTFAIVDLAYNYSKGLRLFAVTRMATDDQTQFGLGAKMFF
ncbi:MULTISPECIES: hypothetical protein [Vibrio]|uniref:hypothetical protein n=1 Tax=Vibrio TaxID=662 RepID=UPI003D0EDC85